MSDLKFISLLRTLTDQPPAIDLSDIAKPSQVEGRVVVITGGNAGLGFGAAEHFAKLKPARLILASRSQEKGDKVVEELKRSTGFDAVEVRLLDALDFASVQAFANGIEKDVGRVDLLILNAGISNVADPEFLTAPNGNELVFVTLPTAHLTNNLGPELLALLLLPTMRKTERENPVGPRPRVVIVSSGVLYMTGLDDELINHPHILKRMSQSDYCTLEVMERRYADTKLFNVWFAKSLQDHLSASNSNIIVNSLAPGVILTSNFAATLSERVKTEALDIFSAKGYTIEEGSRSLVHAALLSSEDREQEKKLKGVFFNYGKVEEISDFAKGDVGTKVQAKLWDETLEELNIVDSRISSIVKENLA